MARMKELSIGLRTGGRHLPAYPCRVADCDALMLFGNRGACDAHPRGENAHMDTRPGDDGLVTVPYRNTTERSTTK